MSASQVDVTVNVLAVNCDHRESIVHLAFILFLLKCKN